MVDPTMSSLVQTTIVVVIIGLCALWASRRLFVLLRGRRGTACGCSGCPAMAAKDPLSPAGPSPLAAPLRGPALSGGAQRRQGDDAKPPSGLEAG